MIPFSNLAIVSIGDCTNNYVPKSRFPLSFISSVRYVKTIGVNNMIVSKSTAWITRQSINTSITCLFHYETLEKLHSAFLELQQYGQQSSESVGWPIWGQKNWKPLSWKNTEQNHAWGREIKRLINAVWWAWAIRMVFLYTLFAVSGKCLHPSRANGNDGALFEIVCPPRFHRGIKINQCIYFNFPKQKLSLLWSFSALNYSCLSSNLNSSFPGYESNTSAT